MHEVGSQGLQLQNRVNSTKKFVSITDDTKGREGKRGEWEVRGRFGGRGAEEGWDGGCTGWEW